MKSGIGEKKYIQGIKGIDINHYAHPERNLIDRSKLYLDFDFGVEKQVLASVITSRSCPFQCVFCSSKAIFGNKLRLRDIPDIRLELKGLKKIGVNTLIFLDDTFSINKQRTLDICSVIKELGFSYWLDTRVDTVDDDIMMALKESGCKFIVFGIESGCPEILHRIKKNITVEQVRKAYKIVNKYDIATKVNFMIGHPGENRQQVMQTIQFATELPATKVSFHKIIPLPGTALFRLLCYDEKSNYNSFVWYKNPSTVSRISKNELEDLQQFAFSEVKERGVLRKIYS